MKKYLSLFVSLVLCCAYVFGICGCSTEEESSSGKISHDTTKWFTATELKNIGLAGLTAPINLTGELSTSDSWFNNGYSFSQPCPDEATFTKNAQIYFDYFKANYDGKFGAAQHYASSSSEFLYNIVQETSIADYYEDNPSPSYKFYFVKDSAVDEYGFYKLHGVYSFEIRYEADSSAPNVKLFKIFIEDAYQNHNGSITYRYKLKLQKFKNVSDDVL